MEPKYHAPGNLKHRPVFLVPYKKYDGQYPMETTDCEYLSLGWAQYDPRSASLKTLRHTGLKWSRQSAEVPLHRAVDLVILLVGAIGSMTDSHLNSINFPAKTFENQPDALLIKASAERGIDGGAFGGKIAEKGIQARLGKLRDMLNSLHDAGRI